MKRGGGRGPSLFSHTEKGNERRKAHFHAVAASGEQKEGWCCNCVGSRERERERKGWNRNGKVGGRFTSLVHPLLPSLSLTLHSLADYVTGCPEKKQPLCSRTKLKIKCAREDILNKLHLGRRNECATLFPVCMVRRQMGMRI